MKNRFQFDSLRHLGFLRFAHDKTARVGCHTDKNDSWVAPLGRYVGLRGKWSCSDFSWPRIPWDFFAAKMAPVWGGENRSLAPSARRSDDNELCASLLGW